MLRLSQSYGHLFLNLIVQVTLVGVKAVLVLTNLNVSLSYVTLVFVTKLLSQQPLHKEDIIFEDSELPLSLV